MTHEHRHGSHSPQAVLPNLRLAGKQVAHHVLPACREQALVHRRRQVARGRTRQLLQL